MKEPQIGELWIHRRTGYIVIVKSLYTIDSEWRDGSTLWRENRGITIVKTIRTRDQYELDEPIGMFTWEYKRLN